MEVPRPFTPQSLAEHWNCSPNTIYRLISSGQLRPFRLGGKLIRISVEEVLRWEKVQANQNTDRIASEFTNSSGIETSLSQGGTKTAPGGVAVLEKQRKNRRDLRFMRS